MATGDITIARLRELLELRRDTGQLIRLVQSGNNRIGAIAGGFDSRGYIRVSVAGKCFQAHRLVWALATGAWPIGMIDHINGVRDDNRPGNLRDVTRSINGQNQRRATLTNRHGVMGACFFKGKWQAQIRIGSKTIYLGRFERAEDANAAYLTAKRKLHPGCTI